MKIYTFTSCCIRICKLISEPRRRISIEKLRSKDEKEETRKQREDEENTQREMKLVVYYVLAEVVRKWVTNIGSMRTSDREKTVMQLKVLLNNSLTNRKALSLENNVYSESLWNRDGDRMVIIK